MTEIPSSMNVSTKQERIARLAREMRGKALTSLSHHIDIEWLREAWRLTRKDGAVGVDGQTAHDYAANLEENLRSLLSRAKSGRYVAPPVRRAHIPKGKGTETRPIGIPTLEDKVLQRAVVMTLEPVYEQDFHDCSYGFRPRRSAHDALNALFDGTMRLGGGWLIEVDIRSFFDALDRRLLREILRRRVRDGVIVRLIGKWLNAGVLEGWGCHRPSTGTPQGGVISPLLANIYLHEVLDEWVAHRVAPKLRGPVQLVRYADDFVLLFQHEADARRVYAALPKRFAEYGLTLHPEKTRLIEFKPPSSRTGEGPRSFDFLGFAHFWAKSRRGRWIVKKRTAKDRFSRAVRRAGEWCRRHRHAPVRWQHQALSRKLMGHYAYYGVTGNYRRLDSFRDEVVRLWHKWLSRRSQKGYLSWEKFHRFLAVHPLPRARIVHPRTRVANL